jgi:branched-chain amino acid transport system substrate-binding protein
MINILFFPKRLLPILAGLILLPLFCFLPSAAHAKKVSEVRIGYILPLTGASSHAGIQNQKACELATEYINAAGGIQSLGGARLVNVWENSRGESSFGVTAAEALITTERVAIISGAWNSAVTYPTTQKAEKAGIPYVVPISVRDTITERGLKYTFRIAAKDSWRTRDQFKFLDEISHVTDTQVKNLAFVYEDGGWGKAIKDQWVKLAEKYGYKVILTEPYASTSSDLTLTAMKIKNARPDIILMASLSPDAILLTNAMAQMKVGAKAVISTGGGFASDAFIKSTGKNCENIFDVSQWEPDINRPGITTLSAEYQKRYTSDLTAETVDAFVSVYVIADALERAQSTDPGKIRDALADTNLCRGKANRAIDIASYNCIEFDKTGQNKNARFVVVQFRDVEGAIERVTVWPADVARKGFKPIFPIP